VQWKPWQVESRVLAGLGEMEEWPAEMVGVENPILRVTVQQAEAAAREIARDISTSAAQGCVLTPKSDTP
jgi:hypothetical protein